MMTKKRRTVSCSHYVLISHLSHQEVEVMEVLLLQAGEAAKRPTAAQVSLLGFKDT